MRRTAGLCFLCLTAFFGLQAASFEQAAAVARPAPEAADQQSDGFEANASARIAKEARKRKAGYTYLNCDGTEPECLISETPVPGVRIVRPKDYSKRPAHYLSSSLYTTLAASRETGGRFVAFDFQTPSGAGPLAHTHRNEWESFFVADGMLTFVEGVNPTPPYALIENDVPAQAVVYGPQGPVHGFLNKTRFGARLFSFAMPAGLDAFFHLAGSEVVDFNAAIPGITPDEIARTAFWSEQRGDGLWPVGAPPPVLAPNTPEMVVSSVTDTKRPTETGPFGETIRVLLTPAEIGNTTGATAFCGPGRPGRPGGSAKYSWFSLDTQRADFPSHATSPYTEVIYTLAGSLSLSFGGLANNTVTVETGTYIQIEPGVRYSMANLRVTGQAASAVRGLAISVIPPAVCQ